MSVFTSRCPSCKGLNRVPNQRVQDKATCGKCKSYLFDGSPIEGTKDNLELLINSGVPVVVDFWASWCNPCIGFAPVFEQAAKERSGTIRFVKVDTEENQVLAARYGIRSIPTVMLFRSGNLIDTISGALPKSQFDSWLNNALTKE